jgi:hypothetical protein
MWIPRLIEEWQKLPHVATEIAEWPDEDAVDYIEEFRHFESKRHDIERAAEKGILTREQMAQLERLCVLVEEHWQIRNWLLRA